MKKVIDVMEPVYSFLKGNGKPIIVGKITEKRLVNLGESGGRRIKRTAKST